MSRPESPTRYPSGGQTGGTQQSPPTIDSTPRIRGRNVARNMSQPPTSALKPKNAIAMPAAWSLKEQREVVQLLGRERVEAMRVEHVQGGREEDAPHRLDDVRGHPQAQH